MPLDPAVDRVLQQARGAGFPAGALDDPALAAEYLTAARAALAAPAPGLPEPIPGGVHEERISDGPRVRIYRGSTDVEQPVLVHFHGGGWVSGSLELNDLACRRLAARTGFVLVSVDYRLAPEHPYPAALEDGLTAITWARTHAARWGGDAARVGVSGSSAGGNLAASLALITRDRALVPLAMQVLVYPVLDPRLDSNSYREHGHGRGLDTAQMRFYWRQYLGAATPDPYAAPALAADLSGLARAVVVSAEFDPLRDEAERYAERLRGSGVDTRSLRVDGQVHGFLGFVGTIASADAALSRIAELIGR